MEICRLIRCFVTLAVLAWCGGARATDVRNLKGMYTCFGDNYKELSVLEGAVAWERGVIRNLYDYAHGQNHDLMISFKGNDLEKEEKKITSSVVKLVREWFFYSGRQGVVTDFKVSNKKLQKHGNVSLSNQEFAEIIAQEVSQLWLLKHYPDIIFDKKIDTTKDSLFEDAVLDGKRIVYLAALWQVCGTDRDALNYYNNKVVERINYLLFDQKTDLENKVQKLQEDIVQFKQNLISAQRSLSELVATNSTDKKSKNRLNKTVKQAEAALKKAIIDRDSSQSFLDKINDITSLQRVVVNFSGEPFSLDTSKSIVEEVKGYQAGQVLSDEQLEKLSFISLMPKDYPPEILSRGDVSFKTEKFADCMEHAIRLLINYFVYNDKFGRFELPADVNVLPALRDFYTSYADAAGAGEKKVHEEFAALIVNIPLVIYKQAIGLSDASGYVKLPQGLTEDQQNQLNVFFVSSGIRVVDDNVDVYEVDPLFRNVIMILNYFFNIGLFNNPQNEQDNQILVDQYISPTFIKNNLERVFSLFGTVESAIGFEKLDGIESLAKVYTHGGYVQEIRLTVVLRNGYDVTMVVQLRQHGYLEAPRKQELELQFFEEFSFDPNKSLVEIMLMPLNQAARFYSAGQSLSFYALMSLLSVPLHNHNSVAGFIDCVERFLSLEQAHILKLATEVNNQEARLKKRRLLMWYQKLLASSFELPELLASLYKFIFELVFYANQKEDTVINAFQALIIQSKKDVLFIITQVIEAAKTLVGVIPENVFALFKALLDTQYPEVQAAVFIKAVKVAQAAVNCNDYYMDWYGRNLGFRLFEELFNRVKNQSTKIQAEVFAKALEVAQAAAQSEYGIVSSKGVDLFIFLLKREDFGEDILKKAFELAQSMLLTKNPFTQSLACSLFNVLLQKEDFKEQALKEFGELEQSMVLSEDDFIRETGIRFFEDLFCLSSDDIRVQLRTRILQLAGVALQSNNVDIKNSGKLLVQALLRAVKFVKSFSSDEA